MTPFSALFFKTRAAVRSGWGIVRPRLHARRVVWHEDALFFFNEAVGNDRSRSPAARSDAHVHVRREINAGEPITSLGFELSVRVVTLPQRRRDVCNAYIGGLRGPETRDEPDAR